MCPAMGAEQPRQPWDPAPAQPAPDPISPEISRRISAILDAAEREVSEIRKQAREDALRYMEYARRRADGLIAERQLRISELSGELVQRAEHLLAQVESAEPLREALDDLVKKLADTAEGLTREADSLGDFAAPPFGEAAAETPPEPLAPAAEMPAPGPTPVPDPAPPPGPPPAPTPLPDPPDPIPPAGAAWPQAPAASMPRPSEAAPEPSGPAAERRDPRRPNADGGRMIAIQMAAAGSSRAQVESHIRETVGVLDPGPILDEVFGPDSAPDATVPWARPR
jgi:hypothetical protein